MPSSHRAHTVYTVYTQSEESHLSIIKVHVTLNLSTQQNAGLMIRHYTDHASFTPNFALTTVFPFLRVLLLMTPGNASSSSLPNRTLL